jgi:hypothetical protein
MSYKIYPSIVTVPIPDVRQRYRLLTDNVGAFIGRR